MSNKISGDRMVFYGKVAKIVTFMRVGLEAIALRNTPISQSFATVLNAFRHQRFDTIICMPPFCRSLSANTSQEETMASSRRW